MRKMFSKYYPHIFGTLTLAVMWGAIVVMATDELIRY